MYNVDIKISKLLPIGCMYKLPCHVFDYYKVDNRMLAILYLSLYREQFSEKNRKQDKME